MHECRYVHMYRDHRIINPWDKISIENSSGSVVESQRFNVMVFAWRVKGRFRIMESIVFPRLRTLPASQCPCKAWGCSHFTPRFSCCGQIFYLNADSMIVTRVLVDGNGLSWEKKKYILNFGRKSWRVKQDSLCILFHINFRKAPRFMNVWKVGELWRQRTKGGFKPLYPSALDCEIYRLVIYIHELAIFWSLQLIPLSIGVPKTPFPKYLSFSCIQWLLLRHDHNFIYGTIQKSGTVEWFS